VYNNLEVDEMILCVYLNPTIDKTVYLDELVVGGTNRPSRIITDGAGKAINVAVVLGMLERETKVAGLLYHSDGQIIKERLRQNGISYDFTELDGVSRTNTKLFDMKAQAITEINESGQTVPAGAVEKVMESIYEIAGQGDIAVLTGSIPPGCGKDVYAVMIRELNRRGVKCVLDADGEALKAGIAERPYMIKPNSDELAVITGKKTETITDITDACKELIKSGISVVAVSMGSKGALLFDRSGIYKADPLKVDVLSTVGAGDSMVAGITANFDAGAEMALKAGVAAATASITLEGTKLATKEIYDEMYGRINIRKINSGDWLK